MFAVCIENYGQKSLLHFFCIVILYLKPLKGIKGVKEISFSENTCYLIQFLIQI